MKCWVLYQCKILHASFWEGGGWVKMKFWVFLYWCKILLNVPPTLLSNWSGYINCTLQPKLSVQLMTSSGSPVRFHVITPGCSLLNYFFCLLTLLKDSHKDLMNHFSQNNEQGNNYCKFNIISILQIFRLISSSVKKPEQAPYQTHWAKIL